MDAEGGVPVADVAKRPGCCKNRVLILPLRGECVRFPPLFLPWESRASLVRLRHVRARQFRAGVAGQFPFCRKPQAVWISHVPRFAWSTRTVPPWLAACVLWQAHAAAEAVLEFPGVCSLHYGNRIST